MSKRIINVFCFLFLLFSQSGEIKGQNIRSALPFHLIFQHLKYQDHLYGFSKNPAWLDVSTLPGGFRARSHVEHHSGSFRLPFNPKSEQQYHLCMEGSKKIQQHDFHGFFTVWHRTRHDVQWVDQESPYSGNPFLFADRSTGDFELNGIFWMGEYQIDFNNWYLGTKAYYRVDQDRKQVFPKPELKHRDMNLQLGIGRKWHPGFYSGISATYVSQQEQIEIRKYNLDQDLTPILYKFRGFDLPIIISGKSAEERLIEGDGWIFETDGEFVLKNFFHLRYLIGNATFHQMSRDGGAYPTDQGNWNYHKSFFRIRNWYPISKQGSRFYLFAGGIRRQESGEYPELGFENYSAKKQQFKGGLGLEWYFTSFRALGIEFFYTSKSWRRTDLLNGILFYVPANQQMITLAYQDKLNTNLSGMLTTGFGRYRPKDNQLFTEDTGSFYRSLFEPEQIYHSHKYNRLLFGGMLRYRHHSNREFRIVGTLEHLSVVNSNKAIDKARICLQFRFELCY